MSHGQRGPPKSPDLRAFGQQARDGIRTPITGMIGMLDLLAPDIKNPAQREKLQFIQQCTGTLRRVIDDILDISQLQGGGVVLENKPFYPALTVERGAKLYGASASLSGTQITTAMPAELTALASSHNKGYR